MVRFPYIAVRRYDPMATKVLATQEEIERQIIQAIRACLEASGKEISNITTETIPMKDLKDFDSLCAIEVVVNLEGNLGMELGEDLFVQGSGSTTRQRSIRQVAEAILESGSKEKRGR